HTVPRLHCSCRETHFRSPGSTQETHHDPAFPPRHAPLNRATAGIGPPHPPPPPHPGPHPIPRAPHRPRPSALAEPVPARTGRTVRTIAADLADASDLARIEETLRHDESITVLVNNAGVGATAPLLQSDVDKMSEMINLNTNALMRLTYAAVPGFVARGHGT